MAVKGSAHITLSFLVDVQACYRYYLLQSSTASAPSAPTANPPGGDWTDTEPGFDSGSTNTLYEVGLTVFTDGSFVYTPVSKSSSYEAAKEAYNRAKTAQTGVSTLSDEVTNMSTRIDGTESSISSVSDRVGTAEKTLAQTTSTLSQTQTALSSAQELLKEVEKAVVEVNAWIKTGKLGTDEDDAAIYGVEIGQQTTKDDIVVFQKFSRLTADRLSFYDQNGTEVSYIGDETMYITNAEISALTAALATLTRLRMGEYLWIAGDDGHYTLS